MIEIDGVVFSRVHTYSHSDTRTFCKKTLFWAQENTKRTLLPKLQIKLCYDLYGNYTIPTVIKMRWFLFVGLWLTITQELLTRFQWNSHKHCLLTWNNHSPVFISIFFSILRWRLLLLSFRDVSILYSTIL